MLLPAPSLSNAPLLGDILFPLVLAAALSGLIGLEREFHGRAAGLRTHIMVCVGTTMAMLVSMALCRSIAGLDPGRIAAGVLTGIGFLGAGAIVRLKNTHRGLTTAACIWFVAALGIAAGIGAYALAVSGTLLALAVLLLLKLAERGVPADAYREIVLVGDRAADLLAAGRDAILEQGMAVKNEEFEDEIDKGTLRVVFAVRFRRGIQSEEVLFRRLRKLPGIRSIAWRSVAT